jgi:ABC-type sugar transport system substrate-binding protein
MIPSGSHPDLAGDPRAVIPKNDKSTFWRIVDKGAQQAGKDLGIRVAWRGPGSEDQRDVQIKIIRYGVITKLFSHRYHPYRFTVVDSV